MQLYLIFQHSVPIHELRAQTRKNFMAILQNIGLPIWYLGFEIYYLINAVILLRN